MTLIEVRDGEGKVTARCDAKCQGAKEPECDCVCGGRYHGKARADNGRELAELVREDGFAYVQALAAAAKGRVGPDLERLCNLSLPGVS